jgi:PhzF family phenazine biosynthesis protein
LYQVDAFTDQAYSGNAAAVCLLDSEPPANWMRAVAVEMNLAETAFAWPSDSDWTLRWFSVTGEMEICGHATLATAHVLWETERLDRDKPIVFETRAGRLGAIHAGDLIELDFPADPPTLVVERAGDVARALGATPSAMSRGRLYWLAEFDSEATVRALVPDFGRLAGVVEDGVVATTRADAVGYEVFSRFFGPSLGSPEDAVTGSSACLLGPYWAPRLNRTTFRAYQEHGTKKRGGLIQVTLRGERVGIGGLAVTVLRGELLAGPTPKSELAS